MNEVSRRRALLSVATSVTLTGCGSAELSNTPTNTADRCEISGPWTATGASSGRTNASTETELPEDPRSERVVVASDVRGEIQTEPVVSDGSIVTAGTAGTVLSRGDDDWRWEASEPTTIQGGPVIGCNRVYVQTTNGLVALEETDGVVLWRRDGGSFGGTSRFASVAAAGDAVYTASGRLTALDPKSGETLWQRSTPDGTDPTALAATDESVVVTTGFSTRPMRVLSYDTDGTKRWERTFETGYSTRPVLADSGVFLATDRRIVRLDRANGETIWEQTGHQGRPRPLAVGSESVLFCTTDGTCRRIGTDTGSIRWQREVGRPTTAPVHLGDTVLLSIDEIPSQLQDQIRDTTTPEEQTDSATAPASGLCEFDADDGSFERFLALGSTRNLTVGSSTALFTSSGGSLWRLSA